MTWLNTSSDKESECPFCSRSLMLNTEYPIHLTQVFGPPTGHLERILRQVWTARGLSASDAGWMQPCLWLTLHCAFALKALFSFATSSVAYSFRYHSKAGSAAWARTAAPLCLAGQSALNCALL
ncbi:hypothetical protein L7F22_056515 [Adiantum nelumboides]|nr:hypothetical protein [Adiantum nelumboides]